MHHLSKKPSEIQVTETRTIYRVSFKRFIGSILDAFNMERGAVYTLQQLFLQPGKMTADYLYEGRFRYVPPFRLLLVSTTLILLIVNYSSLGTSFMEGIEAGNNGKGGQIVKKVFTDYLNLILWLYIPIIALFTWLFNRKSGYNYAENLVLLTYLFSLGNILFGVVLLENILTETGALLVYTLLSGAYNLKAYREFFGKKWGRATGEFLLIFILSTLLYTIATIIVLLAITLILRSTQG